MRLFEVGTKALAAGDATQAYELFDESYALYCIFWGLNMGMLGGDGADLKYVKKSQKKPVKAAPAEMPDVPAAGGMAKLKNWVKNAVNCCIE